MILTRKGQPSHNHRKTMEYNNTPEYETAQSRISALLGQIRDQVQEIATGDGSSCVDDVIAEQDKSFFIFKQNELISAYRDRDVHDERDSYIAKLEQSLAKAQKESEYERKRWLKECMVNKQLKAALKSLTTVLTQD